LYLKFVLFAVRISGSIIDSKLLRKENPEYFLEKEIRMQLEESLAETNSFNKKEGRKVIKTVGYHIDFLLNYFPKKCTYEEVISVIKKVFAELLF